MAKEQPPWRAGQAVRVLRIGESDDPYPVIFLGSGTGHLEHWPTRPPSVPCAGKDNGCRYCGRLPRRYYYYVPALWQDPRTGLLDPWLFQGTACVEEEIRGRDLRGEVWFFQRATAGKTSEVIGKFLEKRDPSTLPESFPIVPILERLFQEKGLKLGISNPNPDRVVPVIGEVPLIKAAELPKEIPFAELPLEEREALQRKLQAAMGKFGKSNGKVAKK